MRQICKYCGRTFYNYHRQKYCDRWCMEADRMFNKPHCPYFKRERYGKNGSVYCEGGRIDFSSSDARREYIKRYCLKYDGDKCSIKEMIDST